MILNGTDNTNISVARIIAITFYLDKAHVGEVVSREEGSIERVLLRLASLDKAHK